MNAKELFQQFESDIIYDIHSLRARVSRSRAGKQIISAAPNILTELAEHLKDYRPPTRFKEIADGVRHGWGTLLSWTCQKHNLDRKGIAQDNFAAWVEWLKDFTHVPA